MAKRLTDTEKWKDEWFVGLNNDYRIVWQWLIDNCNHAGFCKRNISLINLMCRINISEKDLVEKMENRVLIIGNNWFIPKFLKFQYPTLLSAKPAILSVVRELFDKNCIGIIPESFGNSYLIVSESFENHCQMIKVKVKDTVKDTVSLESKKLEVSNGQPQKGKSFNEDKTGVYFPNGDFQRLGQDQKFMLEHGQLSPNSVIHGMIY